MSGYLTPDEIKKAKAIKITPSTQGIEAQRAIILMLANGQPLATYIWNSLVANSASDRNQEIINRAIQSELELLKHRGHVDVTLIDGARSLLARSGIYELSPSGLLIPTTSEVQQVDSDE